MKRIRLFCRKWNQRKRLLSDIEMQEEEAALIGDWDRYSIVNSRWWKVYHAG